MQSENNNTHPNPFAALSEFQAAQSHASGRSRRKPTAEQGSALECLGHAIEYLIDESLLHDDAVDSDVTAAVQLLSAASREVYLSCAECSRENRGTARGALVLWRWLPASSSMLPVFRSGQRR